jgi:inner membrane protein
MDNLTHTLTGVMLARAGLNRLAPRGMALAIIAANIPDIDAISIAGGAGTYFQYHRWLTHAIVSAPIMALLAVLLVTAIFRQRLPWIRAWLAALLAVASHLLLDSTNPYGIRLLAPFSPDWPGLDSTHVIDIWIWAILLMGFFWPMLSGLVSSEIGARKNAGRGTAIAVLVFLTLYDSGRILLHQRAMAILQSRIYNGTAPRRTVAFPQTVNPMRWDGWVETDKAWLALNVDLTREFDPDPVGTFWKPDSIPMLDAARRIPVFAELSQFAKTPYWRVLPAEEPEGAQRVELIDLRFRRNDHQGFTATAVFDAGGRLLRSGFHF